MTESRSRTERREQALSELARLGLSFEQLRDRARHGLLTDDERRIWQLLEDG